MADYPPEGLSASVKALPEWIQLGCGDKEYMCAERGANFPGDECPAELPDLKEHNSVMADILKKKPELYGQLKDKKTAMGVGLAKCIKTGVDNKGHHMIKTVGLVGGDEESYTLFKDLFDPVISDRHNGFAADAIHPTCLDLSKVHTTKLDSTGKYVLTARVRTGRSIRGFRLPPACQFEERRQLEKIIVKGLARLEGDLKGDYFPLHGSRSFADKPEGMTKEKEEELRDSGNLFQEPDSTLLLSSGCGRHWPDARGIYHNNDKNCFVWVNEEDHMRIVSMQKGDDIQAVFSRFVRLCDEVQKVLKEENADFMHSEHLGYILACPSNLGTGLRAGALVKIPLLSAKPEFKGWLGKMGLQARGKGGVDAEANADGIFDISNADRLGKSEVDLVNIMIDGVAKCVELEQKLEKGEAVTLE
jgi:creatine kinase